MIDPGITSLSPEEQELIRQHRERNAKPDWQPKLASAYTVEEKSAAFDRLHALALETYQGIVRTGYKDDAEHWCYEAVMELLGPGVWDATRKLLK